MSNIKAESPAVKDENVSDQQQHHEEQEINQQAGPPNFGGGPRRGGPNRFGNRRPGPYNRGGGGQFGDRGDFRRRGGGAGGPHGGGHHGGPNHNDQGPGGRPQIDKIAEKLANLAGPTFDLPPLEQVEKKFNGRTRLYVGNIGSDVEENEIRELFSPYGESSEYFINKEKNFAFVRMDYRSNAEKAKRELDGILFKGKNLKIRFAPGGSTIKVKNLTPFISNELLYAAFQVFGEVERAYILVDERGKPTGEGIVEFARKGCALHAVRKCSEGCFFLSASLRPCIVESYEPNDDSDGYPEKYIPKKNPEYGKSREVGPRFATPGTFESEYGTRWKQLFELFQQKEAAMRKEFEMEKEKLEAQMEFARYEHETEMLRDQLRAREMDRDRQKHEWEMKERLAEEQRQRNEEQMRRQQEDMQNRIMHQEEEMRRRQQENNLFMQAHQLDNMLEQQEQAYEQPAPMYNNMNEDSEAPVVSDKIEFMKKWEFLYKEKHFLKDYHKQTIQVFTLHYRSNCYYTKTEFKQNEQVQVQHLTENQPQPEDLDRQIVTAPPDVSQLDSLNQADCAIEPVNEASCVGLDNEACEILTRSAAIPMVTLLPSESEKLSCLENGTFKQSTSSDLSPIVEFTSESDFSTKSLVSFTETNENSEQKEHTTQKTSASLVDTSEATDATFVAPTVTLLPSESEKLTCLENGTFKQSTSSDLTSIVEFTSESDFSTKSLGSFTETNENSEQKENTTQKTSASLVDTSEATDATSVAPTVTLLPSESEKLTCLENRTFKQSTSSDLTLIVELSSESDFSTKSLGSFTETNENSEQKENTTQKTSAFLVDTRQATDATSVTSEVNETSQESQDGAFAQIEYGYYTEAWFTKTEHNLYSNQQTNLASQRPYCPSDPVYTTSVSNKINVTSQKWLYEISTPSSKVSCPLSSSESGYCTDQYAAISEPLSCPIQDVNTTSGVNLTNLTSNVNLPSCVTSVPSQANVTCQQWTYGATAPSSTVSCPLPGSETSYSINQQLRAASEANHTNVNSEASSAARPICYLKLPSFYGNALPNKSNVTAQQSTHDPYRTSPLVVLDVDMNQPRFSPYYGRQPAYENNQARFTRFPYNQSRPFYTNRHQNYFGRGPRRGRPHYNRFSPSPMYPGWNNQFTGPLRTPVQQFLAQQQPFYPAPNLTNAINQQNTNVLAAPVSARGYVPYNINEPVSSNSPIFQEHGGSATSVSAPVPVSGYPPSSAINPICSSSSIPQQGVAASSVSAPVSVFRYAPYTGNVEPVCITPMGPNRQAQNGTNDPRVMTHSVPLSTSRYNSRVHHCNQVDSQQSRNYSRRGFPQRYNRFSQNSMIRCPVPQPECFFTQPGTFLENVPQNPETYISNNYFPHSNRNYRNLTWTQQSASSNQPAAPYGSRNLTWTSKAGSSSSQASTQSNASQNLTLTSQACSLPVSSLSSSSTSSLAQNNSTTQKYEYPLFLYMIDGEHPYVIDHEDYNYWFEKLRNENAELSKVFNSNFQMF